MYRAAFLPALLAVVLAMFSLQSRPPALAQGLAADVLFDGRLAAAGARSLAERIPDRRPGRPGSRQAADLVARSFTQRGFALVRERFTQGDRVLENVVARRAGRSPRQVVVIAARDASRVPDLTGSASDTAALLELARVFQGRPSRKTLVLASVDGSTLGELGAARLAESLGDPGSVDGVIEISNLGAALRGGSPIVPWSNDSKRAGIGLQRTLAQSLREELDGPVGATGTAGQLARMSFPIGIGAQGVLLERGFDAVRVSGSGELPPTDDRAIDLDRLGALGRATLRTMTSLDAGGRPEHGPGSYLTAVSQVVPGWVLSLLALAFLLPALVAAVDAFARARRRRESVGPWLRWLAVAVVPFLLALALAQVLALVGAVPDAPAAAVAPEDYPLDGGSLAVLGGITLAGVGAFVAGYLLFVRRDARLRDASVPGAGCTVSLAVTVTSLLLWFVNPYAALLLVPAAHLWMLATLVPAPSRGARLALVAGGLLPALVVAVYYLFRLSLDPLGGAWYLLLLITGRGVGLPTALLGAALLGTLAAAVLAAAARREEPEVPAGRAPVYGPGTYAGPGSLGGTKSALRR